MGEEDHERLSKEEGCHDRRHELVYSTRHVFFEKLRVRDRKSKIQFRDKV